MYKRQGYIHTQGRRFIPELVRGFLNEQEGKKIDFHFQNAATGTLIRGLKEEKFDVIFCSRAEGEKEISFVPVAEEKLVAVVPEDHALAGKNTVTIEEDVYKRQKQFYMRKEKKATALLKILCYSKRYEGKNMNYKNTIREMCIRDRCTEGESGSSGKCIRKF